MPPLSAGWWDHNGAMAMEVSNQPDARFFPSGSPLAAEGRFCILEADLRSCTHHPTRSRPPPASATAPAPAPITTAGDAFSATPMGFCSALEARAPTAPPARPGQSRWGSERSSRGVSRGQGSGQVKFGDTVAVFQASQAARASAAPCSSSGGGDEATHGRS